MLKRRGDFAAAMLIVAVSCPSIGWAKTMVDTLLDKNTMAEFGGTGTVESPAIESIKNSAARATDFPATSTTPGFTYLYNPELDLYERSSVSLGPAFLERAETLGRGHGDIGVAFLYADFKDLDGESLEFPQQPFFLRTVGQRGEGGIFISDARFPTFELTSSVVYFSGSYGITDDFDLNVLIPLFSTHFRVHEVLTLQTGVEKDISVHEDKVGIGDVQLRAKYHFLDVDAFKLAGGLSLITPSGEEGDFQGVGSWRIVPSLVGSYAVGRLDLHASAGFEFDADDVSLSRIRYGIGASYGIVDRLTALVDVIGHSGLEDQRIRIVSNYRQGVGASKQDLENIFGAEVNGSDVDTVIPRTDIVDLSVGFKANPFGNLVVFASAIVPLTSDGVRADVIPAVGVNYSF